MSVQFWLLHIILCLSTLGGKVYRFSHGVSVLQWLYNGLSKGRWSQPATWNNFWNTDKIKPKKDGIVRHILCVKHMYRLESFISVGCLKAFRPSLEITSPDYKAHSFWSIFSPLYSCFPTMNIKTGFRALVLALLMEEKMKPHW